MKLNAQRASGGCEKSALVANCSRRSCACLSSTASTIGELRVPRLPGGGASTDGSRSVSKAPLGHPMGLAIISRCGPMPLHLRPCSMPNPAIYGSSINNFFLFCLPNFKSLISQPHTNAVPFLKGQTYFSNFYYPIQMSLVPNSTICKLYNSKSKSRWDRHIVGKLFPR